MSEQQLRDLIDYASGFAEKRFAKAGVIYPLWHAVKSSGDHFVMPAPPGGKDLGVAIVRAAFELENVVRYVFLDEAWATLGKPIAEKDLAFVQRHGVRAHPDRVEIVMMSGEDAEGGMIMCYRRIIRPAKGKPRLGPLEEMPHRTHAEGRMVGLLPQRGPRQ